MNISRKHYKWIIILFLAVELCLFFKINSLVRNHWDTLYEQLHPSSQVTVYVTNYGSRYHANGCGYLRSINKTTLRSAVKRGYVACSACTTPEYISEYNAIDTWNEYLNSSYPQELWNNHRVFFSFSLIISCFLLFLFMFWPIFISSCTESAKVVRSQKHSSESVPSPHESADQPVEYRMCSFIWICSKLALLYDVEYLEYRHYGISWAVLFYFVTKHIRKQEVVNNIYSHFQTTGTKSLANCPNITRALSLCKAGYRECVILLNDSNIDPRTEEGITELWEFFAERIYSGSQVPENARRNFNTSVSMLRHYTVKYFAVPNSASDSHERYSISQSNPTTPNLPT